MLLEHTVVILHVGFLWLVLTDVVVVVKRNNSIPAQLRKTILEVILYCIHVSLRLKTVQVQVVLLLCHSKENEVGRYMLNFT